VRAPTEEDFDYIVSPCRIAQRVTWCDTHDSRWELDGDRPCEWRLDFENSVKRLLERLEEQR
jgi:hypothetical protein